jgi:hypothetical protein
MSEKKRRWCQFHLSTVLVVMIVIGIEMLFWYQSATFTAWNDPDRGIVYSSDFGWPINAYWRTQPDWKHIAEVLMINLPLNLIPISVVAFFLEWLIRNREAGNP